MSIVLGIAVALLAGFLWGYRVGLKENETDARHQTKFWQDRSREMARREREAMQTLLQMRQKGFEGPPLDEEWGAYAMTNDTELHAEDQLG